MKHHSLFSPKTWLRAGLFTAFAASLSLNIQAQTAPAMQWDKTFGGSGGDNLRSLKQTSDGGYILGGDSQSDITGDKSQACKGGNDFWVVKLDASGNKTWDKSFGGSASEVLYSLQQTADGGYILGGTSLSGISGDKSQVAQGGEDYWVVKLDANGNKIWDKSFGGNTEDRLWSLQQTSDGGYILGGHSFSDISGDKTQASQGYEDYWVVKLDASGNKLWDKAFGGNNRDYCQSLQQTSDGGYILGGYSDSFMSGDKSQGCIGYYDYWVVKLDASGNKIWDKTLGGNGGYSGDNLRSLQQTSDGGYILGGDSDSFISGDKTQACKGSSDYWVVKLDASGNKLWDKTLGGINTDKLVSLQQTSDGGYFLGGTSWSGLSGDKSQASQGLSDFWVVKLDANGNKSWDKTFGGSMSDQLTSLQQTSDGSYIMGGWSNSGISGDKTQACQAGNDYWIVKLAAQAPYLPTDVAVSAVTSANTGCGLTNQENITITVNNFGTASQSNIPVSYKINNGTPVNEVIAGPLAPNTSVSYSFTTKANLSASGIYNIEAKANLTGDGMSANDNFMKVITVYAIPAAPTVTASGAATLCTGGTVTLTAVSTTTGVSYQWHLNGMPISGATSATYIANTAGSYTATAIVAGNCSSPASAAATLTMNTTPPIPAINVTGSLSICSGDSIALTATSSVTGATFAWFRNGNIISGATSATYKAKTAGSYTVTATANGCGSAASLAQYVTINPTPATPTITHTGFVLTSSSNSGNQWYKDNVAIAGATANTYTITSNGSYTVKVTDNGCPSSVSSPVFISTTGLVADMNSLNVAVYPNPSNGLFSITLPEGGGYELTVTEMTGKVIKQLTTKDKNTRLNISDVAKGVYILKIAGEGKTAMRKLVVE